MIEYRAAAGGVYSPRQEGQNALQFRSPCDETALKALNARVERAIKQDKITGTPAFFINGKSVGDGEISLAALEKAVAEASK